MLSGATQLLRLVRDLAPVALPERQQCIAARLLPIVGCEMAAVVLFTAAPTAGARGITISTAGFDDTARKQACLLYRSGKGTEINPIFRARLATEEEEGIAVADRRELVSDEAWYRSAYVNEYRRAWRMDHSIHATSRRADGSALTLCFGRAWGEPAFGDEARTLVRLFLAECAWLLDGPVDPTQKIRATLAPRVRATLEQMLRGASSKEIADRLELGIHTVRHYEKVLHSAFQVRSRTELLARFVAQ